MSKKINLITREDIENEIRQYKNEEFNNYLKENPEFRGALNIDLDDFFINKIVELNNKIEEIRSVNP